MTTDVTAVVRKIGALNPLALFVSVGGGLGAPVWVPFGEDEPLGADDPRPGQSMSYKLPMARLGPVWLL